MAEQSHVGGFSRLVDSPPGTTPFLLVPLQPGAEYPSTAPGMLINLRSNDGKSEFSIELGTPAEYAHDSGFESSMRLRGNHWDGDNTFPFSASVDGLWLRAADLAELRDHISAWLGRPMDRLAVADLEADFELARLPGQHVHVSFGPRPDTISGLNPVVTITFSSGSLNGNFHFVTDQSCLALFVEDFPATGLDSSSSHISP